MIEANVGRQLAGLGLVLLVLVGLAPIGAAANELSLSDALGKLGSSETQERRDAAWAVDQISRDGLPEGDVERVVAALVRALDDRDPQVQWYSLMALGRVGPAAAPAVGRLSELLSDRGQTGYRAAYALGRIGEPAVQAIRAGLASGSDRVRRSAAIAASFLAHDVPGFDDVIDGLIEKLVDSNEDVREVSIESLGTIGKRAVPALERVLLVDDPAIRRGVLLALRSIGADARDAGNLILGACDDSDPGVRRIAVELVVDLDLELERVVPQLVGQLADEDESVRERVALALARVPTELVLPPLTDRLRSTKAEDVDSAATVLARLGSSALPAAPALIEAVLADAREGGDLPAARALGAIGAPAVKALVAALADPRVKQSSARAGAIVAALAEIGEGAVKELARALEADDAFVRACAANALGEIGEAASEARTPLAARLVDADAEVRAAAARALGGIGPGAEITSELSRALDDSDARVRAGAVFALSRVPEGGEAIVGRLRIALADSAVDVRRGAADALAHLGEGAAGAVPELLSALKDSDSGVVRSAVVALGKIGPQAAVGAEALVRLVEDAESPCRVEAAAALGRLGPIAGAVAPLARASSAGDEALRIEAVNALATMGTVAEPALPDLLGILDAEPPEELTLATLRALPRVTSEPGQVAERIAKTMTTGGEKTQEVAIELITEMGPAAEGAAPVLFELLDDRYNRGRIFGALRAIRPRSPEIIRKAIQHEQRFVRVFGCECAAELEGDDARSFIDELGKLASEDGDPRVREKANEALAAIQKKLDERGARRRGGRRRSR